MNTTIQELRRHYSLLSNEQIRRIASYETNGLTPEGLQVLREELQKRALLKEFEHAIDVLTKGLTDEEYESLIEKITTLACPHCGTEQGHLNAFEILRVTSYLIVDVHQRNLVIGCYQCIAQAAKSALTTTLILGWWSLPGIIWTVQAIIKNIKAIKARPDQEPTEVLLNYIEKNAGAIIVRMNNNDALRDLLLGY